MTTPRSLRTESPRAAPNAPAPSDPGGTPSSRAGRTSRREPAAHRTGRAPPGRRPERPDRRDRRGQDGARARAGPAARAASRAPGSCGPGRRRRTSRGCSRSPTSCATLLGDRLPDGAEEVVLARRVSAEGRTRAYLGGRSATAADLRDVGGALLSLLRPARAPQAHARLGAAGDPGRLLRRRRRPPAAPRSPPPTPTSGGCAARSRSCRRRAGARERELDLLEWELQEIERADAERGGGGLAGRRARAAAPPRGADRAPPAARVEALAGESGGRAAAPALAGRLPGRSTPSAASTPELDALADRVMALAVEADDVASEPAPLRRGGGGHARPAGRGRGAARAAGPAEAQARRHDGRGARATPRTCRRRRDELTGAEEALEDAEARARRGPRGAASARGELRTARTAAAGALAAPCASASPRWPWRARPSRRR